MTLLNELNVGSQQYGMMGVVPMGTCATPAGTAIKESAFADDFALSAGNLISVTFTYANTYGDGSTTYPSLKVGSYTYPIKYPTGAYAASGAWANGQAVTFMFDGVNLIMTHPVATAVEAGNNLPVSSAAVADIYYQGVKYSTSYDCNTIGEGLALVNELTLNTPYKQGLTTATIAYIYTKLILPLAGYRIQFAVSYNSNELFVRSYTDSGWVAWQRELKNIDLTSSVTSGSSAPITSGGVFSALSAKIGWAIETYNGQNRAWTIPSNLEQGVYILAVTDLYQDWEYLALGVFYNYTSENKAYRPILEYGLNVSLTSDLSQLQVQSGRYIYRLKLLKIGY